MFNGAKRNLRGEISGLLLVAVAIYAFLALAGRGGMFGEILATGLELAAGSVGAKLLPILAAAVGLLLVVAPGIGHRGQRTGGLILATALVLTLIHLRYTPQEFIYAQRAMGGGYIGAGIAAGFRLAFGLAGRALLLCVLAVTAVLMLSNLSLPELIVALFRSVRAGLSRTISPLINLFYDDVPDRRRTAGRRADGEADDDDDGPGPGGRTKQRKVIDLAARRRPIVPAADLPTGPSRGSVTPGEPPTGVPEARQKPPAQRPPRPAPATASGHQYELPPLDLLSEAGKQKAGVGQKDIQAKTRLIEETLASFNVAAKVIDCQRGPTVTRFELQPASGVKITRIVSLADDLALALAAQGVRIEAPIPGKAAIGIEVPNNEISIVYMREVLETKDFTDPGSRLTVALGKDVAGKPLVGNLEKMIHLLIAGATGSGKSVCVNSIITSLLYRATPDEVKFLMIDPKMVELTTYNGIPHLICPVVTDPKKAATALKWVVAEMQRRYELFVGAGVRDITKYNQSLHNKAEGLFTPREGEDRPKPLPYIIVILDELADLMMVAPVDVEDAIFRLAQMARAAGIHLIVATQRPSVDVITGVIKANIPSRIAFAVAGQVDSRTILDANGAEKLLGRGDMLYSPVGSMKPTRAQGAYVSDGEVEAIADWCRDQALPEYELGVVTEVEDEAAAADEASDELFPQAVRVVIESGQASVSLVQRRLRVGYARAGRLIDMMEEKGYIGRHEGSKPRDVLITMDQYRRAFGEERDK